MSDSDLAIGRIYPSLAEVKEVSVAIAIEVAKMAYDEGTFVYYHFNYSNLIVIIKLLDFKSKT